MNIFSFFYSSTISTPITEKVTEGGHIRETNLFPYIYLNFYILPIYNLGSECCTSLSLSSTGTAFLSQPYSFGTYILNITSHGGQVHSTHIYKKGAIIFFGGHHWKLPIFKT